METTTTTHRYVSQLHTTHRYYCCLIVNRCHGTRLTAAETPSSKTENYEKLSSDREIISFNVQQLIDEINSKRKRDTSLVTGKHS